MSHLRVGKDGPRWAFWTRMQLHDLATDATFLERLRLVQTPWFGIYLHRMDGPDPGVDLHDHPWWFASIILRGGYVEECCDAREASYLAAVTDVARRVGTVNGFPPSVSRGNQRVWREGSVHTVHLGQAHCIRSLLRVPTWTLVIVGPRRRDWGFYIPDGYVDHRVFEEMKESRGRNVATTGTTRSF